MPGTLHILLNLDAGAWQEMVATDNASYSDTVFGVFSLLGYDFSPASATLRTGGSGGWRCPGWTPAGTGRRPATRST